MSVSTADHGRGSDSGAGYSASAMPGAQGPGSGFSDWHARPTPNYTAIIMKALGMLIAVPSALMLVPFLFSGGREAGMFGGLLIVGLVLKGFGDLLEYLRRLAEHFDPPR